MKREAILFRGQTSVGSESSAIYLDGHRFVVVEKYLTIEEAGSLLVILGKNAYAAVIEDSHLSDTNFLEYFISNGSGFPFLQDTIIDKWNSYGN